MSNNISKTKTINSNWGKKIIDYLPNSMRSFVINISPIITIGLSLTYFFTSLRVYVTIEAGVIFDHVPAWTLSIIALPLIIGPFIPWIFNFNKINKEYWLLAIGLMRLLVEIVPNPLLKFVFSALLVIVSLSWIVFLIPTVLKEYGYQITTISIISSAVFDISLRAPTLTAEPAIDNNWYGHIFIILSIGLFLVEGFVFISKIENNIIKSEEMKTHKKHGLLEGFVFIQGMIIYYLFYGNAGLIAQGFRITNSLATIILLTWYMLLIIIMQYIGITFRDKEFYSLNYAVILPSAVVLLAATYMVPWSNFLLYPAPFFASLSLFFIIDRAVLTSQEMDIKQFSKGASVSLIITLLFLFGYVYYEKIGYIMIYLLIFGIASYFSVRNYRRTLDEQQ